MYSRPAFDIDWFRSTVCNESTNPPLYLKCDSLDSEVSPSDNKPGPPSIVVASREKLSATITIQMDNFPEDVGWKLDKIDFDAVEVAGRLPGIYRLPNQLVTETVALEEDVLYRFVIYDLNGDGICCQFGEGMYKVVLKDEREVVMADGSFGDGQDHFFLASLTDTLEPSPPVPANPTAPATGSYLTLLVLFDDFPNEVGWVLQQYVGGEIKIVAFRSPRSYGQEKARTTVQEVIPLTKDNGEYAFHFTDSFGDGVCCRFGDGGYTLFLGEASDGVVLSTGDGTKEREVTKFSLLGNNQAPIPTKPATTIDTAVSEHPPSSVVVSVDPDKYPKDVAWRIVDDGGRVLKEVPLGRYTRPGRKEEEVELQKDTAYKFIIFDANRDGLCCMDGSGSYEIRNKNGLLAQGGRFKAREITTFMMDGEYPVRLSVKTDKYPKEVGWSLVRLDVNPMATVAAVLPGTYNETDAVIDTTLLVSKGGLYRWQLDDTNSDGICCDFGEGSLRINVGSEMTTIFEGSGDYGATSSVTFVAGTDSASLQPPIQSSTEPSSGSNPPPTSPIGGNDTDEAGATLRNLTLQIMFDQWPEEVSWYLSKMGPSRNATDTIPTSTVRRFAKSQSSLVAFGPRSPFDKALANEQVEIVISVESLGLNQVQDYAFVLLDSGGDGLCCAYGMGTVRLYDAGPSSSVPSSTKTLLFETDATGVDRHTELFTLSNAAPVTTNQETEPPTTPGAGSSASRLIGTGFVTLAGSLIAAVVSWAISID